MFSVAKAKRQLQLFYLCESVATATTNVLSVAKAKRQLQSAQPERISTPHFTKKTYFNTTTEPETELDYFEK
ncbi:hypothetical protein LSPCS325_16740 [Lysinibacillus sp. CTST325]